MLSPFSNFLSPYYQLTTDLTTLQIPCSHFTTYSSMNLYKYLIVLSICTLVAWLAWFFVILLMNPNSGGLLSFIFFYLTLIMALVGTFSVFGYIFRAFIKHDELAYKHVNVASRQSVLLTFLVVSTLLLQSFRVLMWWNLLLLILVTAFIELFFISYKKSNR